MAEIILKPNREKSVLRRHPWIYSGAIAEVIGSPELGETVIVRDANGAFLSTGAYSPQSQIRVRIWTWDEREEISPEFFTNKLSRAIGIRAQLPDLRNTNAYRLVHGESDGIPGLVLDRYNDTLVAQFLSSGTEIWRETIIQCLNRLMDVRCIYERSDADVRTLEGLTLRNGLLFGEEPQERVLIQENGISFQVDIRAGHKTGFYLDQRLNRQRVKYLSEGRDVLDCFCYTGGFTLAALSGGATAVTAVDSSSNQLSAGRMNLTLNSFTTTGNVEWVEGDVFHFLRGLRDRGRSFDMIVLDPPKFAASVSQLERASRGYKDINLLAFKLLRPGGILASFSCSGSVSLDLFQKIVAGAALDAGVEAKVIETLHQASDHPMALNFPEGSYLKGFLVYV